MQNIFQTENKTLEPPAVHSKQPSQKKHPTNQNTSTK